MEPSVNCSLVDDSLQQHDEHGFILNAGGKTIKSDAAQPPPRPATGHASHIAGRHTTTADKGQDRHDAREFCAPSRPCTLGQYAGQHGKLSHTSKGVAANLEQGPEP